MSGKDIRTETSPRRKRCAHCADRFDFTDFTTYLLQRNSESVLCVRCQKPSFLLFPKTHTFWPHAVRIIVYVIGLILALLGLAFMVSFLIGETSVLPIWVVLLCFGLSALAIRQSMRLVRWFFYEPRTSTIEE